MFMSWYETYVVLSVIQRVAEYYFCVVSDEIIIHGTFCLIVTCC
jgi:hypothetical protein